MARTRKSRERNDTAEPLPVNVIQLPTAIAPPQEMTPEKGAEEQFLTQDEFRALLDEVPKMKFEEVIEKSEHGNLSPGQKVHMLKVWAEKQQNGAATQNSEPGFVKTVLMGAQIISKKAFVGVKDGAPGWFFHVWSILLAAATRYRIYQEKGKADSSEYFFSTFFTTVSMISISVGAVTRGMIKGWNWNIITPLIICWSSQLLSLLYEIGRKSLKEKK